MSIVQILFNPNGRIRANEFWRGLIVLIGIGVVLSVAQFYGPPVVTIVAGLAGFVSFYMYICVFGKRLHDSDKTAWLCLLFFVGYFILYTMATLIVFPMVEGYTQLQAEMTEEIEANGFDFEILAAYSERTTKLVFLPNMILTPVVGLVVGWFCARLWSNPYPNKYGEPVGGFVESDDEDEYFT